MKIAVIGAGNVGVAIATDLSIKGHEVSLLKTSSYKAEGYNRLISNSNRVYLKEKGEYGKISINEVSSDLSKIKDAEVVFCTIQSNFYEDLVKRIKDYLNKDQIVICICSYASSYYFEKYCKELPMLVEATGPYLEGRVELDDKPNEIVFRVGYRHHSIPAAVFSNLYKKKIVDKLHNVYDGFTFRYKTVIEAALLNPNMVLHTVGSLLSLTRIEYSKGDFCMYREAYARQNHATLKVMIRLDREKLRVLKALEQEQICVFEAGGFNVHDSIESFHRYSESSDRAISPTSVHSRYITEDVSQGLVLLESIADRIHIDTPITTALISIASAALGEDFRKTGRTIKKLGIENEIDMLYESR